jgi:hypothetical protein
MNGSHTLKHLEAIVGRHRLTPRCQCGRPGDVGLNVDHPSKNPGAWICRRCEKPENYRAPK